MTAYYGTILDEANSQFGYFFTISECFCSIGLSLSDKLLFQICEILQKWGYIMKCSGMGGIRLNRGGRG